jgi:pyrimidine-nucleoside phosphorylase
VIRPAELIQRKRDGGEIAPDEIFELVLGYARGEIPDYQMSAFCMATYFQGMSSAETFALTQAMVRSGKTLDLRAAIGRKVVDKHSTGGVGDKTSLAVGPIVAACGVPFAKMSGRGLGHTGGTLDKLEAIPGFRVALTSEQFVEQVRGIGLAIIGQTADLVPADKLLYGLRDVTATVDNVSLIASSIMSKKIAGGADAIVLDVKVGEGAFMKTLPEARTLAEAMLDLGRRAGRELVCLLTEMDQPLGQAVGNALEVHEAVATLRGQGPADFTELVLASSGRLLALSDLGVDEAEARRRAEAAVRDGSALATYRRWIAAQGGDADEAALPTAPVVRDVPATQAGFVASISAVAIGLAALRLGAGRRTKDAEIDHSVGVRCLAKRGDSVDVGQPLAQVHTQDGESAARAVAEVGRAYAFAGEASPKRPIVLETIA